MLNMLIMAAGAISLAVGLGSSSFVFGCSIAGSGNLAGANGVRTGLLVCIAVGVWGISALLLHGKPGRG